MIIIPIGIDCGNSDFLKKYNIRKFAYYRLIGLLLTMAYLIL